MNTANHTTAPPILELQMLRFVAQAEQIHDDAVIPRLYQERLRIMRKLNNPAATTEISQSTRKRFAEVSASFWGQHAEKFAVKI